MHFETLNNHLKQVRAYPCNKIQLQEPLGADCVFKNGPEHKQRKHIENNMLKPAVHKHVRNGLPWFEEGRIKIKCPQKRSNRAIGIAMIDQ